MARRIAQLALMFACASSIIAATGGASASQSISRRAGKATPAQTTRTPPPRCGDLVSFQVLLDRQNFSPGQIDGASGANFTHALSALQQARHVPETGQPDCETWHALGGDSAGSLLESYTI